MVNLAENRYTLTGEIGRGGMAVVHRARDNRHGRDVAVKVMLPRMAASVDAGRFAREIDTAARLQHPHIVPVFDSGRSGDDLFFVMPLIEGETLRSRLTREGRLAVAESVRIVGEVADALDYAHSQGVVHRDVKPENILLSRGHALLADFGIARTPRRDGQTALTQAGTSFGTPAYMSPELASGETEVGAASDVYALGCILFELLTGAPPFTGSTYQAILVKRFTHGAPRVRSVRPDVPTTVDDLIAGALERDPTRRVPTARTFAEALVAPVPKASGAMGPSAGARSIVVLPFDNLSPDAGDAYLAEGLTDELITDLSKVGALRVIARNSAAAAKARTRDLREIAGLLDARYVVEGSVRRAGDDLRINAQLIDSTTDAHVWADKFAGTMHDVFGMQERISEAIVKQLRARLTPGESAQHTTRATDVAVYELFLRGRHYFAQSLMRYPEAAECLREALRRDPTFSPAACALGFALNLVAAFSLREPAEVWQELEVLGNQARTADPRSGPAHLLLAHVALYRDWDFAKADALAKRAVELGIAGTDAIGLAMFYALRGDSASARRVAEAARRDDPLHYMGPIAGAIVKSYSGAIDEALEDAERLLTLDPNFPEGYHWKGYLNLIAGRPEAAVPWLEKAVDMSHRWSWPVAKLGCAYAGLGRRDEAITLLNELESRAKTEVICRPAVAALHLHLGNRDGFFDWMERAIDTRDPFAVSLRREALWASLQGDPQFEALARRVGPAAGSAT